MVSPEKTVIAYHNTRLLSLVEGTPSYGLDIGTGILNDRRLRYGICTHALDAGANVYGDRGLETFENSSGWIQFEVKCCKTTRLRGGRRSRHCINGPGNTPCTKAALMALWVPYDELPHAIYFS